MSGAKPVLVGRGNVRLCGSLGAYVLLHHLQTGSIIYRLPLVRKIGFIMQHGVTRNISKLVQELKILIKFPGFVSIRHTTFNYIHLFGVFFVRI